MELSAVAPRAAAPSPGTMVAGKYRIERILGQGGMGIVCAATHVLTSKHVALKWLLPTAHTDKNAYDRFVREAQAAGRIHHPSVVQIFDVGTHEGSPYIVMELLEGESFSSRLARGAPEPAEVCTWMVQAIRGLAAAHKAGVVHRDLKPDNIFLCNTEETPVAKVLDFGISKISDSTSVTLTRSGVTMGTAFYMSPEQVKDSKDLDYRTDIYSIGVMLYEALAGRVPFEGESFGAVIIEIATADVVPLGELRKGLPIGLEAVVRKAMARNAGDRYQSMDALAAALRPFTLNGRVSLPDTSESFAIEKPEPGDEELDSIEPLLRGRSVTPWAILLSVVTVVALTAYFVRSVARETDEPDQGAPSPSATSLPAAGTEEQRPEAPQVTTPAVEAVGAPPSQSPSPSPSREALSQAREPRGTMEARTRTLASPSPTPPTPAPVVHTAPPSPPPAPPTPPPTQRTPTGRTGGLDQSQF